MDIARLRDLIEQTETEAAALRMENDTLGRQLSKNAVASGMMNLSAPIPRSVQPPAPIFSPDILLPDLVPKTEAPSIDEHEYILRMDMSDSTRTPIFRVSRSPSPSFGARTDMFSPSVVGTEAFSPSVFSPGVFSPSVSEVERTPTMTLTAMNMSNFSAASDPVSSGLTDEQTELVINFILS